MQSVRRDANGFDGLRLLAAVMVLFSHSYPLRGISTQEPIAHVTETLSFGSIAVYVFFAISGYLVTQSWQRDPNLSRFLCRRLMRIIPALACVVLLTFLVIGPLMTALPAADYFRDPDSWRYLLTVLMYPVQYHLPGVFLDNPYPEAVNGSLWTLRLEFSFYLTVAFMGCAGLWRWNWMASGIVLCCLVVYVGGDQIATFQALPYFKQLMLIASNGIPFFLGAALARNRGEFEPKPWHLWFLTALAFCCFGILPFKYIAPTAAAVVTLITALHVRMDLRRVVGDWSYGFYLWAFVVQQIVMHMMPAVGFASFLLISGISTLVLAALSWHLVEKNALHLARSVALAFPTEHRRTAANARVR